MQDAMRMVTEAENTLTPAIILVTSFVAIFKQPL